MELLLRSREPNRALHEPIATQPDASDLDRYHTSLLYHAYKQLRFRCVHLCRCLLIPIILSAAHLFYDEFLLPFP